MIFEGRVKTFLAKPLTFDAQLGVSNCLLPVFFRCFGVFPAAGTSTESSHWKHPSSMDSSFWKNIGCVARGYDLMVHSSCERDSSSSTWRWWFPNCWKFHFCKRPPSLRCQPSVYRGGHQFPSFPSQEVADGSSVSVPCVSYLTGWEGNVGKLEDVEKATKVDWGYTFTIIAVRK